MTMYPDLFADLAAPFLPHEVKARPQGGRQLSYVTARTIMNRLDSVVGPENWWDEYTPGDGFVLCKLSIRLPDGAVITKADAGGAAGMQDAGDDEKSAFSDALKRAAARWGVGRYLYGDGVPAYQTAPIIEAPVARQAPQPAAVAVEVAPEPAPAPARAPRHAPPTGPAAAVQANGPVAPKTGKALFAWASDLDKRSEAGMIKFLTGWGRHQEFPTRMIEWDADQVAQAYAEATRKLQGGGQPAPANGKAELVGAH